MDFKQWDSTLVPRLRELIRKEVEDAAEEGITIHDWQVVKEIKDLIEHYYTPHEGD